jgi:hypothetical protein
MDAHGHHALTDLRGCMSLEKFPDSGAFHCAGASALQLA